MGSLPTTCLLVLLVLLVGGASWGGVVHAQRRQIHGVSLGRNLKRSLVLPARYEDGEDFVLDGGIAKKVGEYYVELTVGTPGQTFRMTVDTGSSTTALPSISCQNCDSHSTPYDPGQSSSEAILSCSESRCSVCRGDDRCLFEVAYGDGSGIEGYLVEENARLGDLDVRFVFGAISSLRGDRPWQDNEVDGILGIAYPVLNCNPTCTQPLFEELVATGHVDNVFSMTLTDSDGVLTLGGADPDLYQTDYAGCPDTGEPGVCFTPITRELYYDVAMWDLRVENQSVVNPSDFSRTIIDSGTNRILFPQTVFDKFKHYMQDNFCHLKGICGVYSFFESYSYDLTPEEIHAYPTLDFMLDGLFIPLRPEYYLIPVPPQRREGEQQKTMLSIMTMASIQNTILGSPFMRAYYVIHDRMNQRIGFACTKGDTACGLTTGPKAPESDAPFWNGVRILAITLGAGCLLMLSVFFIAKRRQQQHPPVPPVNYIRMEEAGVLPPVDVSVSAVQQA